MKAQQFHGWRSQIVSVKGAKPPLCLHQTYRAPGYAALSLSLLLCFPGSGSAQSQDHCPFTLSAQAAILGAAANCSADSIALQTYVAESAVPAETLTAEKGESCSDSGPGGHSSSSTQPSAACPSPAHVAEGEPTEIAANPGRPAMATSALLTPVGYAQIETGLLYANDSAQFSSRAAEEEALRITVTPRAQLIVAAEPIVGSQVAPRELVQRGDTTAGIQVVMMPGDGIKPTISASYLRLLRDGNATTLDIGHFVNSAVLLESADLGHFHIDCNEFLNETVGPIRRMQFGQAVAVTRPVNAKLSATAELRHFTEPLNAGDGWSGLWAASYALRPNLVFDTGLVRGFTSASTGWQVASGVTYVLPHRIWGFSRTTARQ